VSTNTDPRSRRWPTLAGWLCLMGRRRAGRDRRAAAHPRASDDERGPAQGTVYATLQDSQGFIWLGTEDGLVRFDGHELVRYAYSPNARGGLPGNFICQIAEDAQPRPMDRDQGRGRGAAGTATANTFTVYTATDPANPASLASDATNTVLVDARGRIWVGTRDAGLDMLDPVSGRIEHLRHDPSNPASLTDDRIYSLTLDRAGNLWIGTEPDWIDDSPRAASSTSATWRRRPALAERQPDFKRAGGPKRSALGRHPRWRPR